MNISRDEINKLPKAELHCHLDGSLRINTIIELAKEQNIALPYSTLNELTESLIINNVGSLEEYLKRFEITLSVLQTPESLTRASYELAEDCWNDGVKYAEIRYSPILHTKKGMTPSDSIDAVQKGLLEASNQYGIQTGIIICGIRNIPPEISLTLAKLAVKYKNSGVVGFDLAGAEENFPAKEHREAFYMIQNNNINSTIHAGEAFGPSSIHQAIHYCNANRIGHGTRLHEDHDLMNYVNDHRIALEICLTSNVHVKSVRSVDHHPFKLYLDKDIRVTLNTDNRLISDTTLTDEYKLAIDTFNLNAKQLRRIIINGFKSAFLPHNKRIELIKSAIKELEAILKVEKLDFI